MKINQALLKHLFEYEEGDLVWKKRTSNRIKVGDIVGHLSSIGYIQVRVNNILYAAHRLIYMYHNGLIPEGMEVDHINGIRDDNRIENLRAVTHKQNTFNRTKAKGYSYDKTRGKYQACICIDGKTKHLGRYSKEEDARQSYLNAKQEFHIIDEG
jgi:hypothetical protein